MNARLRGLRDIRTLSGDGAVERAGTRTRSRALLRLGVLDLERERRRRERESAQARIELIDRRLREIAVEEAALGGPLGLTAGEPAASRASVRPGGAARPVGPGAARPRVRTLRY